jgi:hypothetical protein
MSRGPMLAAGSSKLWAQARELLGEVDV